jgi:hypothetical protein
VFLKLVEKKNIFEITTFLSVRASFCFLRAQLFQKDGKSFLETKFRLSGVTTVCIKALLPRVYIGRSASERRQSE